MPPIPPPPQGEPGARVVLGLVHFQPLSRRGAPALSSVVAAIVRFKRRVSVPWGAHDWCGGRSSSWTTCRGARTFSSLCQKPDKLRIKVHMSQADPSSSAGLLHRPMVPHGGALLPEPAWEHPEGQATAPGCPQVQAPEGRLPYYQLGGCAQRPHSLTPLLRQGALPRDSESLEWEQMESDSARTPAGSPASHGLCGSFPVAAVAVGSATNQVL